MSHKDLFSDIKGSIAYSEITLSKLFGNFRFKLSLSFTSCEFPVGFKIWENNSFVFIVATKK